MRMRTFREHRARPVAAVACAVLALVASVLFWTVPAYRVGDGPEPAAAPPAPTGSAVPTGPSPSAPPSLPEKPDRTAVGAYLDYDADGVRRISKFADWLGGAEVLVGHTYLPGDSWENIAGGHGFLDPWAKWRKGDPDRLFVLNVPMMENNEGGLGDDEVRDLLRQGADGAFDQHFLKLAQRLVRLGIPDTVLVPGWEMNGTTYTHRCGPDPDAWKAYWRRMVKVMRMAEGQQLRFDFTASRGRDAVPWTECYPGDDVVDIVGLDAYDQPEGMSFDEQVTEPYGLQAHVDFAAEHDKPISFPEWGLFRNGDNPEYMRGMLDWMERHRPLYQTVTDYCPHGVWQCEQNPDSAAVFRETVSDGRAPEDAGEPSTPSDPGDGPDGPGGEPEQCDSSGFGAWWREIFGDGDGDC